MLKLDYNTKTDNFTLNVSGIVSGSNVVLSLDTGATFTLLSLHSFVAYDDSHVSAVLGFLNSLVNTSLRDYIYTVIAGNGQSINCVRCVADNVTICNDEYDKFYFLLSLCNYDLAVLGKELFTCYTMNRYSVDGDLMLSSFNKQKYINQCKKRLLTDDLKNNVINFSEFMAVINNHTKSLNEREK